MPKQLLDLDAALGTDDGPQHTRQIRLFGKDWTLVCDNNSFAFADAATGDPAAIIRFIDSLIITEEHAAFHAAFAAQRNMSADRLNAILMALIEAAAERPTTPPSVSRPGRQNPTSPRKSAASSSVRRAAR